MIAKEEWDDCIDFFKSLGMVWLSATPEQCEMTEEARGSTSSQHVTAPQSDVDADHRALCDHNKTLPVSLPASYAEDTTRSCWHPISVRKRLNAIRKNKNYIPFTRNLV